MVIRHIREIRVFLKRWEVESRICVLIIYNLEFRILRNSPRFPEGKFLTAAPPRFRWCRLHAVHGGRGYGRLFVRLGDAQVECGKAFVLARDVYARLQSGVIDGETLYDFHVGD